MTIKAQPKGWDPQAKNIGEKNLGGQETNLTIRGVLGHCQRGGGGGGGRRDSS